MTHSERILTAIVVVMGVLTFAQFCQIYVVTYWSTDRKDEDRLRLRNVAIVTWMKVALLAFGLLTIAVVSAP